MLISSLLNTIPNVFLDNLHFLHSSGYYEINMHTYKDEYKYIYGKHVAKMNGACTLLSNIKGKNSYKNA